MKKGIFDRKIPSLLGIALIIIGVVVTTLLVKGPSLLRINAGPNEEPKKIEVTNISDSSFTVTYMTDTQALGTLNFGKDQNNLDQVVLDDRDQLSQKVNKYQTHSISTNSLEPNTTYYFKINSGSTEASNNGAPFVVKTGPKIDSSPSTQPPMAGKVINPDGSLPSDGLVIVNTNGAEKLSTYLRKDGSYLIPLNNLRTEDLTNYFELNGNSNFNVKVSSANLSSGVNVSSNQLSPVPLITLSNNYDFSEENQAPKVSSSPSANFKDLTFPKASGTKKKLNIRSSR